jgi:parvulin-like peptidyl-prolyl isomerase
VKSAAFALQKAGDLSPVITTANGFYVLKLIERREAGRRPLAEVKEAIAYQLSVAKREHTQQMFYETMKAGLKIEINRPLLDSIATPAIQTETRPPSMPAS